MAETVDWGSLISKEEANSPKRTQRNYMKFENGKTHTVRPVGNAVCISKFYVATDKGKRFVFVEPKDAEAAAALISKHFGREIKAQTRYAINVFDREDNNQVKIMEGGFSIFRHFAKWSQVNKDNEGRPISVGGTHSGDWMIEVRGDGLQRKYVTGYMRPAPFTPQEVKAIKEDKKLYQLQEIYKGTPLNEVVSRLTGEPLPETDDSAANIDDDILSAADNPQAW